MSPSTAGIKLGQKDTQQWLGNAEDYFCKDSDLCCETFPGKGETPKDL